MPSSWKDGNGPWMEVTNSWTSSKKTNKPLAYLHEQDVSGFSVFIYCSIVSPLRILGPSNGRVNGPVSRRGVLVFKLATVEGSGFLSSLKLTVCHFKIWYLAPKTGLKLKTCLFSCSKPAAPHFHDVQFWGWIPTRRSLGKLRMFPLHGAIENRSLNQRSSGEGNHWDTPFFGGVYFWWYTS